MLELIRGLFYYYWLSEHLLIITLHTWYNTWVPVLSSTMFACSTAITTVHAAHQCICWSICSCCMCVRCIGILTVLTLNTALHTLKELKVITQSWHGNLGSRSFLYFPTSLSNFICWTIMWNLHSGNSFFHCTVSESMWLIHPVLRSLQLMPPPPCSIIHVSIVDFSLFYIFLYFVRSDYVLYFDFAARCKLLKRNDEVLESRLRL